MILETRIDYINGSDVDFILSYGDNLEKLFKKNWVFCLVYVDNLRAPLLYNIKSQKMICGGLFDEEEEACIKQFVIKQSDIIENVGFTLVELLSHITDIKTAVNKFLLYAFCTNSIKFI